MDGRVELRKAGAEQKVFGLVAHIQYVGDRPDIPLFGRVETGADLVDNLVTSDGIESGGGAVGLPTRFNRIDQPCSSGPNDDRFIGTVPDRINLSDHHGANASCFIISRNHQGARHVVGNDPYPA
ncbi:hypothetical protein P053_01669 [Brucella abortus 01-4165]|nr:hypothetical protein DK48_2785 [Brucella abortus]AIJ91757.1 hypothetical protein DK55_3011 [Brucella abortus bv. 2 str. 86/8/59]AOG45727.1 hypothetical protein BFS01_15425 [Brucella sp. 2002734562]EEP62504.1 Hypothetical protein BAAA_7001071 [Brucella abortus str. 2308 A]EHR08344.1 hypothetical protein M19_02934 [Brucella abortus bv. 1 str. NI474]EHR10163.1 hypothetical protein M17_01852 [Brucella abortus bv. 1 str. NI435a]EHR11948.1 hypothetical protein M1A_01264 [Brucella abortus bv. 1 s